MNMEKMRYYVDVVKYNSFTKAAQANYISQAAISQQIASIEEELGFKCFERTKTGLVITEGGKSFYSSCLRILSLYAQSLSRARCVAHSLSGNISLGLWPGLDNTPVYQAVSRLLQFYPDVRVVIRNGTPVEFWHKINASKLAVAIVMPYDFYDRKAPETVIEPLITCQFSVYVSTTSHLAQQETITLEQLRGEKVIVQGESGIGVQTFSHLVVEQMQHRHQLKPEFIVSNFETQQILVAANRAVMMMPDCCRPTMPDCLKKLRLVDYPETCDFSFVWSPTNASPGLIKFTQLLKQCYASLAEEYRREERA